MRITKREVIKSGEQELIDAITADLDWEVIEEVFREEHHLEIDDNVEYKKGDIVVYNDQIAYQLEFDVKVALAVLVDREGNYISVTTHSDQDALDDEFETALVDESNKESNNSYEAALSEFESIESTEHGGKPADPLKPDDSPDNLELLAFQAGNVLSEIEAEKRPDGKANH